MSNLPQKVTIVFDRAAKGDEVIRLVTGLRTEQEREFLLLRSGRDVSIEWVKDPSDPQRSFGP
jgi:hypothetical protein